MKECGVVVDEVSRERKVVQSNPAGECQLTHGKNFAECPTKMFAECQLIHGKHFAECPTKNTRQGSFMTLCLPSQVCRGWLGKHFVVICCVIAQSTRQTVVYLLL